MTDLSENEAAAIWVIAGEKSAYGGPNGAMGFGGRLNHTAIYRLRGDGFPDAITRNGTIPIKGSLRRCSDRTRCLRG